MLQFNLWEKVSSKNKFPLLCLSCVRKKLARDLTEEDFIDAPVNKGIFGFNASEYVKHQNE
jgi:hypothetical protein